MTVKATGIAEAKKQLRRRGIRATELPGRGSAQYIEPLPARLIPAVTATWTSTAASARRTHSQAIQRSNDRFSGQHAAESFWRKNLLTLDSNATQLGLDKLITDPQTLALKRPGVETI